MSQITNTVLMIRPVQFRMNEQTAVNNYYQKVLEDTLMAQASQGDQKAIMAVVQIRKNPENMQNILDKIHL